MFRDGILRRHYMEAANMQAEIKPSIETKFKVITKIRSAGNAGPDCDASDEIEAAYLALGILSADCGSYLVSRYF